MSNFKEYSQYYDLLYKDKDYKSESIYVIETLKRFHPDINTMLEYGCGSGGHAQFFSELGIEITGIERSEDMVNEAKKKHIPKFTPIVGDITNFSLEKEFDAVISLFHLISYITDNNDLIKCLNLANQHLKPNGLFLFDFWFTPAVLSLKPETRVKRLENQYISIVRVAESHCNHQKNVVDVHFEINIKDKNTNQLQTLNEVHPMRHFSLPELDLLAKLTGFEIVNSEEFQTQKSPNETTWGVCVVFKKIKL